jgi:hypothetical protein
MIKINRIFPNSKFKFQAKLTVFFFLFSIQNLFFNYKTKMEDKLTVEQINNTNEFKLKFPIYDRDGNETISTKYFGR